MRFVHPNYSRFYDRVTRVEFSPVLDRQTSVYVGVAEVSDPATIEALKKHPIIKPITDEQYAQIIGMALPSAPVAAKPKPKSEKPEDV